MSRRIAIGIPLVCALVVTAIVIGVRHLHPAVAPKPLGRAFYVWQQEWRDSTREAVLRAAPAADDLEVFAAEARWQDGRCTIRRHAPDWAVLAQAGRPVVAVVRMGVEFAKPLESKTERTVIAGDLALLASALRDRATAAGATLAGLQLDYDCPTARLVGYRALLDDLRGDIPFRVPFDADPSGAALRPARGSLSEDNRTTTSTRSSLSGDDWITTSTHLAASAVEDVSKGQVEADAGSTGNRARAGAPRHLSAKSLEQARDAEARRRAAPSGPAALATPPTLALSITTLPTWLSSRDFPRLVGSLDHFVLQVHSFDPPKSVRAPDTLCDVARVEGWVTAAARSHVPFWVALPTYGYVAVFAPDGSFRQILAENAPSSLSPAPGVTLRTVRADPAALAGLVGRLTARHPGECRGIVWFRLPVAADRLNWSWPALAAVMQGRVPHAQYAAELRHPQPDLYELWLSDTGEDNTADRVRAAVAWPGRRLVAADGLNAFAVSGAEASAPAARGPQPALSANEPGAESARVEGPAPQPGRPILAAWFRFAPTDAEATSVTVVSILPCPHDAPKL